MDQDTSFDWVSFLKSAWQQIQLAWAKEDPSHFASGSRSSSRTTKSKGTAVQAVAIANRLTKSAINKTRTSQGLTIVANIEMAAIHILYMLREVDVKLKALHKYIFIYWH